MRMLDRNDELSTEYDSDQSSTSNDDSIHIPHLLSKRKILLSKYNQSSKKTCCLICSILPALSKINCCEKHLTLLTKINHLMQSAYENDSESECRNRIRCPKGKYRRRSYSSSTFDDQPRRKKNRMDVQLLNTTFRNRLLPSSNFQSNRILLPSVLRNSTMNKNNSRQQNRILSSSSILTRNKRRYMFRKRFMMRNKAIQTNLRSVKDKSTTPELIELEPELSYSPRLLLKRIVHIKDEELSVHTSQVALNMNRSTERMTNQSEARPTILLKRVRFDKE
ncbi:hypothetical protein I4U23_008124 [Adineta vaga]|nr:hypothetical protein I4U23_008124 [Adineta vaga]